MATTDIVQHTPEPWRVSTNGVVVATSGPIAYLGGASLEGDARLIAAAPTMLAILEGIQSTPFVPGCKRDRTGSGEGTVSLTDGQWEAINAAIAKARGQQ